MRRLAVEAAIGRGDHDGPRSTLFVLLQEGPVRLQSRQEHVVRRGAGAEMARGQLLKDTR